MFPSAVEICPRSNGMHRLAGLVDVRAVFDAVDIEGVLFDIEGEQHAVVTTAGGAQAQEFIGEGLTEPAGIIGQDTGDEFDDSGGSLL